MRLKNMLYSLLCCVLLKNDIVALRIRVLCGVSEDERQMRVTWYRVCVRISVLYL